MTTSRLVVTPAFGGWQPKTKNSRFGSARVSGARKTKTNTKIDFSFGSSRSGVLVAAALFLAALAYLYFINASAVKGFEERRIEKEIEELRKENDRLKIREAELKSLYYIEESSKKLNMSDLQRVSYAQERGPVALNR